MRATARRSARQNKQWIRITLVCAVGSVCGLSECEQREMIINLGGERTRKQKTHSRCLGISILACSSSVGLLVRVGGRSCAGGVSGEHLGAALVEHGLHARAHRLHPLRELVGAGAGAGAGARDRA